MVRKANREQVGSAVKLPNTGLWAYSNLIGTLSVNRLTCTA